MEESVSRYENISFKQNLRTVTFFRVKLLIVSKPFVVNYNPDNLTLVLLNTFFKFLTSCCYCKFF